MLSRDFWLAVIILGGSVSPLGQLVVADALLWLGGCAAAALLVGAQVALSGAAAARQLPDKGCDSEQAAADAEEAVEAEAEDPDAEPNGTPSPNPRIPEAESPLRDIANTPHSSSQTHRQLPTTPTTSQPNPIETPKSSRRIRRASPSSRPISRDGKRRRIAAEQPTADFTRLFLSTPRRRRHLPGAVVRRADFGLRRCDVFGSRLNAAAETPNNQTIAELLRDIEKSAASSGGSSARVADASPLNRSLDSPQLIRIAAAGEHYLEDFPFGDAHRANWSLPAAATRLCFDSPRQSAESSPRYSTGLETSLRNSLGVDSSARYSIESSARYSETSHRFSIQSQRFDQNPSLPQNFGIAPPLLQIDPSAQSTVVPPLSLISATTNESDSGVASGRSDAPPPRPLDSSDSFGESLFDDLLSASGAVGDSAASARYLLSALSAAETTSEASREHGDQRRHSQVGSAELSHRQLSSELNSYRSDRANHSFHSDRHYPSTRQSHRSDCPHSATARDFHWTSDLSSDEGGDENFEYSGCSVSRHNEPRILLSKRRPIAMSDGHLAACAGDCHHASTSSASYLYDNNGDLRRVPSDLSHCRQRIDATVVEHRRTRELIEDLQDKVRNFRLHQAEVDAALTTPRSHHNDSPPLSYRFSRKHRSMGSLDDVELEEEELGTISKRQLSVSDRPSSSGGRLNRSDRKEKGVSFTVDGDLDDTLPNPQGQSTPKSSRNRSLYHSVNESFHSTREPVSISDRIAEVAQSQADNQLRINAKLMHQLKDVECQYATLVAQNEQLRYEATSLKGRNDALEQACHQKMTFALGNVKWLKNRIQDLSVDIRSELEHYAANMDQGKVIGSVIKQLAGSRSAVQAAIPEQKLRIQQLQTENERLDELLRNRDLAANGLEHELTEERRRRNEFEEKYDSTVRAKFTLENEISTLRSDLNKTKKEKDEIEQTFEQERTDWTRRQTEWKREANADAEKANRKVEELRNEVDRLNSLTIEYRQQAEIAIGEHQKATEELRQLERSFQSTVAERDTTVTNITTLETTIHQLNADLQSANSRHETTIRELRAQLSEAQKSVAAHTESSADFRSSIDRRDQLIAQQQGRIRELEALENAQTRILADLRLRIDQMEATRTENAGEFEVLRNRLKELLAENRQLSREVDTERRNVTSLLNDKTALNNEIHRRDLLLKDTNREKESLAQSVTTLEAENTSMKQKFRDLNREFDSIKAQDDEKRLKVLSQRRTDVDTENRRLRNEIQRVHHMHENREQEMVMTLQSMEKQLDEHNDKIDQWRAIDRENALLRQLVPAQQLASVRQQMAAAGFPTTTVRPTYQFQRTPSFTRSASARPAPKPAAATTSTAIDIPIVTTKMPARPLPVVSSAADISAVPSTTITASLERRPSSSGDSRIPRHVSSTSEQYVRRVIHTSTITTSTPSATAPPRR